VIAALFPGQGSQTPGMGRDLFDEFRELTAAADEILGFSVKALCLGQSPHDLTNTRFAQPALYVVCALAYLRHVASTGRPPDFVAGHSLGEYTALFAANAYEFGVGLRLVAKRGELMSRVQNGGMAAVGGLNADQVTCIVDENPALGLDVANLNSPSQIVVSGPRDAIRAAQPMFEAAGARMYLPLQVSGAFHSRYMAAVRDELAAFANGLAMRRPEVPVISNVEARPYDSDPRDLLLRQLTSPVRWADSVHYLLDHGVSEFVEMGPGTTLTRLVDAIRKERKSPPPPPPATAPAPREVAAPAVVRDPRPRLGSAAFCAAHGASVALAVAASDRGVTSPDLVVRCAEAGVLSFLGSRDLPPDQLDAGLRSIQARLVRAQPFGIGMRCDFTDTARDQQIVAACLARRVDAIEARGYLQVTPDLVRFRFQGAAARDTDRADRRRLVVRVSRPETAVAFMSAAPEPVIAQLVAAGDLADADAARARREPVASDICVEGDGSGPTDGATALALLPVVVHLRDQMCADTAAEHRIRVGLVGGIGSPAAVAAAFTMGADFVMTGAIHQCTVEAATSDIVKEMLAAADVPDTALAPASDLFELGARSRVLKKGVFFAARAERLFNLYLAHDSIDALPAAVRGQLEQQYFGRSLEEVESMVDDVHATPKQRMARIFRRYLDESASRAIEGNAVHRVNFAVPCSAAMGAVNRWLAGTPLREWQDRHADELSLRLLDEAAHLLSTRARLYAMAH